MRWVNELTSKIKENVVYCFILILPFILFWWMMPFVGSQTIGNDYLLFGINNQMELLFSIWKGSFPLFIPGYAGGQSASALTLGQIFHPISLFVSFMPGYWDGLALEWNTFLRLISLGFTHLMLFIFLRKLGLRAYLSFMLSTITVYNLRMLDLFRYTAVESYTGHLLLCVAVGYHYLERTRWWIPFCIIGATYLLVCSGHTQMMYYGLLGAMLFAVIFPFFLPTILPNRAIDMKAIIIFWLRSSLCCGLGILLSSAYILPLYFDFLVTNGQRVGQEYAWATAHQDTPTGIFNNFFLPFRSDVHAIFGGSVLFLVAVLLPILRFFKVSIPYTIWVIWVLIILVILHMLGDNTPVHYLAWKYLPFAIYLRAAGRISLILPILMMLLLTWFLRLKNSPPQFSRKKSNSHPLAYYIIVVLAIYILASGYIHYTHKYNTHSPMQIRAIPQWIEAVFFLSCILGLYVLVLYLTLSNHSKVLGLTLAMILLIQVAVVLPYGTWAELKYKTKTLEQMSLEKIENLAYRPDPGYAMSSSIVDNQLKRAFPEECLARIYTKYTVASDIEDAYNKMGVRQRPPNQLFIVGYPYDRIPGAAKILEGGNPNIKLVYSSFNRLLFEAYSPTPAFFLLSYPYTGHWKSRVDGQDVPNYPANGALHAVEIPAGKSMVEFRYWSPSSFIGVALSCATFLIIGLYFSSKALTGSNRLLMAVIVLVIGVSIFLLWYTSLYAGDNLGAIYTWSFEGGCS